MALFISGQAISGERWTDTLIHLFDTPANRLAPFLGRSFMHLLV